MADPRGELGTQPGCRLAQLHVCRNPLCVDFSGAPRDLARAQRLVISLDPFFNFLTLVPCRGSLATLPAQSCGRKPGRPWSGSAGAHCARVATSPTSTWRRYIGSMEAGGYVARVAARISLRSAPLQLVLAAGRVSGLHLATNRVRRRAWSRLFWDFRRAAERGQVLGVGHTAARRRYHACQTFKARFARQR